MSEQFKDQGGVATMDPSPLKRWVTSRLMTHLFSPSRVEKQHEKVESQRLKEGAPHKVEYFHQVDDGYSYLAAQVLAKFLSRYDVELDCHLVSAPAGKNVAEPELLSRLSRYDSHCVSSGYGLDFPAHEHELNEALVAQATAILAAQDAAGFSANAARVGHALWRDDAEALASLAEEIGTVSVEEAEQKVAAGTERRQQLQHYSGAMFYYGGEWYWGVDRLYHLEHRLTALGADRQATTNTLIPRPGLSVGDDKDDGRLTLEVYASLRSPYTSIIFDRAVKLARDAGVTLAMRPVLPMVMRGVPATRQKGMYIFMDTAREAQAAGVPYGKFYDPIGNPARRCYSLYDWADRQGKGVELISTFLSHAFAQGTNTNNDRGLQKVVEQAGLDWEQASKILGNGDWEPALEDNRLAMYDAGLWGVPSFRLLDEDGEALLSLWGQDRLWVIAQEIKRQVAARRAPVTDALQVNFE